MWRQLRPPLIASDSASVGPPRAASQAPRSPWCIPARCALIALILLASATFPLLGEQEKLHPDGDLSGRPIRQIVVESDGPVTNLSETDLLRLIHFRVGDTLSRTAVRGTILALMSTELFLDVRVETEPDSDEGVVVRLLLVRKYVVKQILFRGDLRLPERILRRELAVREGEPYADEHLDETLERLNSAYRANGYYSARISHRSELDLEKAGVKLIFEVQGGPQAQVRGLDFDVEGDVPVARLQERMKLRKWGYYSDVARDEDVRALEALYAVHGYLRADIYFQDGGDYDPASNMVDLVLRVVPGPRSEIRIDGFEFKPEQLASLPVFVRRALNRSTVRETREELRRLVQQNGYFQAQVDVELRPDDEEPDQAFFVIDKGTKFLLLRLEFSGNKFIDDASLESVLSLKETDLFQKGLFTTGALEQDLADIKFVYEQNGFLDVQVRYELRANPETTLAIVFVIEEGPRYSVSSLSFSGNQQVESEFLTNRVALRPGQPFSPFRITRDRAAVLAAYEDLGFRGTDFRSEAVAVGENQFDVTYRVTEGTRLYTDQIIIVGNRDTRRGVIAREITLKEGDPLSFGKLMESETNLYDLGIFSRVRLREKDFQEDPQARAVLATVEESRKYTLLYGFGYSYSLGSTSSDGLRGTFGITDNNFRGTGRAVSLGVRVGSLRQWGNISYTLRRLPFTKLPTIASFTVENENRVNTTEQTVRGRPYDAFRIGFGIQAQKPLSRRESLFFRYRFEKQLLTVPPELEIPLEFYRQDENLQISAPGLAYINESRDNPRDPGSGFFLSGDTELAAKMLGSDSQLFRILTQGQYYKKLGNPIILASSLRIGIIAPFRNGNSGDSPSNPVPVSERFYAGGATTLRGLPPDLAGPLLRNEDGNVILVNQGTADKPKYRPVAEGGNFLLIGNLELRFPLLSIVKGSVFYDVGNVFESLTKLSSIPFSHAVGFGLFVPTPIGPIRIDMAYNPDPPDIVGFKTWNFHFNIGHPF